MTDNTNDLLRVIYRSWQNSDFQTMAIHLANNVCHNIRVSKDVHPLGGARHGSTLVIERLKLIDSQFTSNSFIVEEQLVGESRAAAQVRIARVHKISGLQYRSTVGHFWSFSDDLVTHIDEYHDMADVLAYTAKSVVRV